MGRVVLCGGWIQVWVSRRVYGAGCSMGWMDLSVGE